MTTNPATDNNIKSDIFCVHNNILYDIIPTPSDDNNTEQEQIEDNFDDYIEEGDEWIYVDNNSLMEKPPGRMDYTIFAKIDKINRLSIEAQKFIENNFEINTILRIRENMQPHDFDEEGPTEEIWELLVQTTDNNVHFFSYHHFWSRGMRLGYSMDNY
jgi:hypothetical protein